MLSGKERSPMKKIKQEELYGHLREFLKGKGIELQEGSYTRQIQHGCRILADTVNLSQQALHQARSAVGERLDQVRQVIHEKTAPPSSATGAKAGGRKRPAKAAAAAKSPKTKAKR
jgi:hypothetical protein